jgi:hypothetical protein
VAPNALAQSKTDNPFNVTSASEQKYTTMPPQLQHFVVQESMTLVADLTFVSEAQPPRLMLLMFLVMQFKKEQLRINTEESS